MLDRIKRKEFVDYLNRLVDGRASNKDWFNYIVEHYRDEELEEVRVKIVHLRIAAGDSEVFPLTGEHREKLRNWAQELS